MDYFQNATITQHCQLPIYYLNKDINSTITNYLKENIENKCIHQGYIEKDSVHVLTISCGVLVEDRIEYSVTFECRICYPVEGMIIECNIENITKAGVKASIVHANNPMIIFVSRDLHLENEEFSMLNIGDMIRVKVIGVRFEINDNFISVIAEYIGNAG